MHADTPRRVILVKSIVIDTKIEQIHKCIIHFALLISPSCKKKRVVTALFVSFIGQQCQKAAAVSIYRDEGRKLRGLVVYGLRGSS